jgi:hypothetical protein
LELRLQLRGFYPLKNPSKRHSNWGATKATRQIHWCDGVVNPHFMPTILLYLYQTMSIWQMNSRNCS